MRTGRSAPGARCAPAAAHQELDAHRPQRTVSSMRTGRSCTRSSTSRSAPGARCAPAAAPAAHQELDAHRPQRTRSSTGRSCTRSSTGRSFLLAVKIEQSRLYFPWIPSDHPCMAQEDTSIQQATAGLSPSRRSKILELWGDNKSAARSEMLASFRNRRKTAEMAQYRTPALLAVSFAGGFAAEYVRRSLVSRYVTSCRSQALGIAAVGIGAAYVLGRWATIPYAQVFGAAHVAYAGTLLAISMHGKDEAKDPLVVAVEGTAYRVLHPPKKEGK